MKKGLILAAALLAVGCASPLNAQSAPSTSTAVSIDWNHAEYISRTTPTLQVVVNPPLRRGNVVHDGAYQAVKKLKADYVRYVPWLPYPKLAVAELSPPTAQGTSWDFSLIDPMTIDFFNATKGHSRIINFSTIPQWMYVTPKPVAYPADPNQVTWDYEQGTELRDPSMKEVADYYARLVSWYTDGGFTDENGKYHHSGYHYSIPYWEVLNEIEGEHHMSPKTYTAMYDAIVSAIQAVAPKTQFVGMALMAPKNSPFFAYFLDHKNHRPGVPLDFISYHFYATPRGGQTADQWQDTFFAEADNFLQTVRHAEEIRKRLSPETKTTIDELGVILPDDNSPEAYKRITPIYWNAAAALYAYVYVGLSKQGIDVAGESQLVGCPSQFPSVSMIDWNNGKPNARFRVLQLIKEHFGPGDAMMATACEPANPGLLAQGYKTHDGRRLLLINKRNVEQTVQLSDRAKRIEMVDLSTGENPPQVLKLHDASITLSPFEVAVVDIK
ncbi:MAG TPA: hypothetical protein VGG19_15925 [Tepidisphaeraceae bacterium]|jgi:hypothetical protein